jgi:hypothetical protein
VPFISKDITTSGVFLEEEEKMRAQQLELIYSQSGILCNIFPDASQSILDKPKKKYRPYADGIVALEK